MKSAPDTQSLSFANSSLFHHVKIDMEGKVLQTEGALNNLLSNDYTFFLSPFFRDSLTSSCQKSWEALVKSIMDSPIDKRCISLIHVSPAEEKLLVKWEFSLTQSSNESYLEGLGVLYSSIENRTSFTKLSRKLDLYLSSISDSFISVTKDYEIVHVNNAFAELAHKAKEALIGSNLKSIIPHQKDDALFECIREAMDTRHLIRSEIKLSSFKRWFNLSIYALESEIVLYLKDITSYVNTLHTLQEHRYKLRSILNSTTEPNILISPKFKVLSFNKIAHLTFRSPQNEFLAEGQDFLKYLIPGTEENFIKEFRTALEGKEIIIERLIPLAEGQQVWMEITYTPVFDDTEQLIGIASNSKNIDKRKRYQLVLMEQNIRLKEIADIQSHKFRGPLARILGLILLINGENLTNEEKTYLTYIKQNAEELDQLVFKIVDKTQDIPLKESPSEERFQ